MQKDEKIILHQILHWIGFRPKEKNPRTKMFDPGISLFYPKTDEHPYSR